MKGEISITRILGEKTFVIRLEDESSGLHILRLELTAENLALALGNQAGIECEYDLNKPALEYAGLQREHKTEVVKVPRQGPYTDEVINQAVAMFCIDGWMVNHPESTIGNHHYQVDSGEPNRIGYKVNFVRFC